MTVKDIGPQQQSFDLEKVWSGRHLQLTFAKDVSA